MTTLATVIWNKFAQLPGSAVNGIVGIASVHAIGGLIRIIRTCRPKAVLELGAGIGTLTYTIASALPVNTRQFYSMENEDFCLSQLPVNLSEFDGKYLLVRSLEEIPAGLLFDLIVVDGGGELPNDMGMVDFSGRLKPGGVILVEGGRKDQCRRILSWYGMRPHLYCKISPWTPYIRSTVTPGKVKNKPYQLFLFEPSLVLRFHYSLLSRVSRFWEHISWRLNPVA